MNSWPVQRIGRIAKTISGSGFPPEYQGQEQGDLPFVKVSDLARSENFNGIVGAANCVSHADQRLLGARTIPSGAVVFPKVGAALLGNARAITLTNCLLDNNMMAIVPRDGDVRFWKYVLLTVDLGELSGSGPLPYVSDSQIRDIRISFPPTFEQRRIADFLDAETARIDGLRAKRLAQISVLDELELARIREYLAAAHSTGPVYAYFEVQLGKKLNAVHTSGDGQALYLRNANVHWYEIDTDDMASMSFDAAERRFYALRPGDLMVCEGGAGVAEAAVWDARISNCFYQMSLHRVRARKQVPVEWLMYWLRYSKAIGVFNADGKLATIPHLTAEQLAGYRIPIPDDGDCRVAELSTEIAAIRETQRKMEAANAVLAERRQALITAAVTGGITV